MPAHKKGKARAERRERAAARESDAVQQPEASTAAQQPGPSVLLQQPEPSNAVQRGVTGVQPEGEENTEQLTNVE